MKAHVLTVPLFLLAVGCATTRSATPEPAAEPQAEADATAEEVAPTPDPSIPVAVEAESLVQTAPLQTVVLTNEATPLVTFRLVFRTGSVDDPVGKEGLTALTAAVLSEGGTQELSSAELIEALFPMAAELSMSVEKELTVYEGRVHRDHLEAFVPLFVEVLTSPRFAESEFDRLRDRALTELRNGLRNEDDEALGQAALESIIYAGHPAAHPVVGTESGLEAITLADVQAHWKSVFTQDRLIVGLGGAVNDALAQDLVGRLGALAATGAARKPLPPTPAVAGRTLILQRPTLSTAVSMGFTYPVRRGHPDFYALAFALSYLGEHRQSIGVLFNELREKRGLNYGDYAYV
ncbi:MAG TPA: pitrilysin family protein, partial [Myxococcaceae bacterium]|nr:pitrilysin family protein [Myxococcaceae bacterium]